MRRLFGTQGALPNFPPRYNVAPTQDVPGVFLQEGQRTLGLIFGQPSTRTRISFATAMIQLGGGYLTLTPDEMQLSRGESLFDTAHVLSRYVDAIVLRTFEQERLEALGDGLEVITRMLGEGRATYHGRWATVKGAINVPKGVQPRIPVIVGGNGENVTFRYAAKHATELNLVFLDRARVAEALPVIRSRCEEIGRDPATLRVSLYCRDEAVREPGQARVDFVGGLAELGLARLVAFPTRWDPTAEAQASFAADCRTAGIVLA